VCVWVCVCAERGREFVGDRKESLFLNYTTGMEQGWETKTSRSEFGWEIQNDPGSWAR
jgi:hypothetical protein